MDVALELRGSLVSEAVQWTPEAEARLKEIPFFVRPAARKKIEKFAQESGIQQITVEIYEQAKQKFGS
nr:PCP reductase family protein [Thermostichus vulcanus]